jgi:hypothetical protein
MLAARPPCVYPLSVTGLSILRGLAGPAPRPSAGRLAARGSIRAVAREMLEPVPACLITDSGWMSP